MKLENAGRFMNPIFGQFGRGIGKCRAAIAVGLFALMISGILVWAVVVFISRSNPFDGRSFDRKLWFEKAGSYEEDNPRAQMIADLLDNHLFVGMNKHDVEKLLGAPDLLSPSQEWEYLLGMWSGMRIDFDTLTIEFGEDGRITKLSVLQH